MKILANKKQKREKGMINATQSEAAPLGTIKDFLSDLRSDINNIKSYKEFKEDKPYLLGWISNIELILGLKAELK